ncbi:MAG: hypothetical protein M0Z59_01375 [Nitrospiraceae bacterium]|nr:hypothetical protein [Nitrospiraceae bacterium]
MRAHEGAGYKLMITGDGKKLLFRTPSYRVERGSILSAGIYNLELSSMIAAAVPALAALVLLAGQKTAFQYAAAILAFVAGFLLFRVFVFKKRELELMMDRENGSAFLHIPFRGEKAFSMADVEGVSAGRQRLGGKNPEGMELVEKIALHHGTVVPDFGQEMEIYTVEMKLRDGRSMVIYSGREKDATAEITIKIKEFLESGFFHAQEN